MVTTAGCQAGEKRGRREQGHTKVGVCVRERGASKEAGGLGCVCVCLCMGYSVRHCACGSIALRICPWRCTYQQSYRTLHVHIKRCMCILNDPFMYGSIHRGRVPRERRCVYEYYPTKQCTYRYLIDRCGDQDIGPLIRNTLASQIVSQRARHAVDIGPPVGRSSAMVT